MSQIKLRRVQSRLRQIQKIETHLRQNGCMAGSAPTQFSRAFEMGLIGDITLYAAKAWSESATSLCAYGYGRSPGEALVNSAAQFNKSCVYEAFGVGEHAVVSFDKDVSRARRTLKQRRDFYASLKSAEVYTLGRVEGYDSLELLFTESRFTKKSFESLLLLDTSQQETNFYGLVTTGRIARRRMKKVAPHHPLVCAMKAAGQMSDSIKGSRAIHVSSSLKSLLNISIVVPTLTRSSRPLDLHGWREFSRLNKLVILDQLNDFN